MLGFGGVNPRRLINGAPPASHCSHAITNSIFIPGVSRVLDQSSRGADTAKARTTRLEGGLGQIAVAVATTSCCPLGNEKSVAVLSSLASFVSLLDKLQTSQRARGRRAQFMTVAMAIAMAIAITSCCPWAMRSCVWSLHHSTVAVAVAIGSGACTLPLLRRHLT